MKTLKLSPWHDGSVKPVHVGIYQVNSGNDGFKFYSWWDGKFFNGHWTLETAYDNRKFFHKNPDGCSETTKWRGVLK